jgi:tetratricopeptide (TPR) repeat protein
MAEVFISYSSVNKTAADEVCEALERSEISCWIAPRNIGVGSYASAIIKGIQDCKLMVLVFSSHSNKSPQVEREIERAVSKGKTIYPLRIENVVPSPDLELFISSEQWMDAFEGSLSDHLDKFCENVKALLAGLPVSDTTTTDEILAPAPRPSFSKIWTVISLLALTLALGIAATAIFTVQRGGVNAIFVGGTLTLILLLALVAGAFIPWRRPFLERLIKRFNWKLRAPAKMWLALGVLLVIVGLRFLLPDAVARYLVSKGDRAVADKQFAAAIGNYEGAARVKPSHQSAQAKLASAHFALAIESDKKHDYAPAIAHYQSCIALDPANFSAHNNLARLLILQQRDYNGALRRLDYLRERLAQLPVGIEYYLFKNRGWANLELHNYGQAQADLEWALIKRDGAAAHYLMGRVFEDAGQKAGAKREYSDFVRIIQQSSEETEQVEPEWIAHAQEQLTKGG